MPKLTFLPFNVGEPLRPALGRQLANFLSEAYKSQPDVETNFVRRLIGDMNQSPALPGGSPEQFS